MAIVFALLAVAIEATFVVWARLPAPATEVGIVGEVSTQAIAFTQFVV